MPSTMQFGQYRAADLPVFAILLLSMQGPAWCQFAPTMRVPPVRHAGVRSREEGRSALPDSTTFRPKWGGSEIRLRILIWLNIASGWYTSVTMMMIKDLSLAAACAVAIIHASSAIAQDATEIQVTYSNGQFQPNELHAPADRPVVFRVKNLDPAAMEFESESLRVEKVVAGKTDGVINVRALKPGRYEFHDDFNDKARGALTVQ
jgi:Cupredoxin-like domain